MPSPTSIHVPAMCPSPFSLEQSCFPERSEPKHMVERETARTIHQTMITDQTAGGIPHQHVTIGARGREFCLPEHLVGPDHHRAGTGDADCFGRDVTAA